MNGCQSELNNKSQHIQPSCRMRSTQRWRVLHFQPECEIGVSHICDLGAVT